MRGRFITFEGGEGSGKTTQIERLARYLAGRGIAVTVTREPGGTPKAEAIRAALLAGAFREMGPDAEAVLFAAARADHVERLIRPALRRGEWVLCDRFTDSTRAYQGAGDGVDEALIRSLERLAVGRTRPDLTIILDLPVEEGMARLAGRQARGAGIGADRFEADELERHRKRRQAFLDIAKAEPERCAVVDATPAADQVAAAIRQLVEGRLVSRAA